MPAHMIEHRFDHMRLDAKLCHVGGDAAPNVVDDPQREFRMRNFYPLVQVGLRITVAAEAVIGQPKHTKTRSSWGPNKLLSFRNQRYRMCTTVLDPIRRQHKLGIVNLVPAQLSYFCFTLAGEDQQFNNTTEVVIAALLPNGNKF